MLVSNLNQLAQGFSSHSFSTKRLLLSSPNVRVDNSRFFSEELFHCSEADLWETPFSLKSPKKFFLSSAYLCAVYTSPSAASSMDVVATCLTWAGPFFFFLVFFTGFGFLAPAATSASPFFSSKLFLYWAFCGNGFGAGSSMAFFKAASTWSCVHICSLQMALAMWLLNGLFELFPLWFNTISIAPVRKIPKIYFNTNVEFSQDA